MRLTGHDTVSRIHKWYTRCTRHFPPLLVAQLISVRLYAVVGTNVVLRRSGRNRMVCTADSGYLRPGLATTP
eukprot:4747215-Prymnesium_polylepis.1